MEAEMGQSKKTDRSYPDELHRELGMTPEEVRQSYVDDGIDPDAAVAQMRRLGVVMAAKYAPQIEREERARNPGFDAPLPIYRESVAAGAPAWADPASAAPGKASLSDVLAGGKAEDTILAKVSGWSMRDDGINDGDYVMVNVKMEAKDGDMVLAHIAGEGQVIKRLRKKRGIIVLESANPDFKDIVVKDPSTLRIHGVVVGRAGKI
jgi:SOS-response transcriptional repressor LexA